MRDERRDHHPVLAALPRADGVEEAGDRAVEVVLDVVGERQELVHRLRVRVGPAALGRRPVDPPRRLLEGSLLAVVAVDLGGRGDENALVEPMAVLEDDLRAAEIRDECAHRLVDDQPHPDRSREVVDDVAAVDELVDDGRLQNAVDDQMKPVAITEMLDVLQRAGREVVERPDVPAVVEKPLGEIRADEACAAGDECLARHRGEVTDLGPAGSAKLPLHWAPRQARPGAGSKTCGRTCV